MKVVTSYQHLIYGFLAGAMSVWWFGGRGGEYTGYLCVAAVGAFIYYESNKNKPKIFTFIDAIKAIVKEAQRGAIDLDADVNQVEFVQLAKSLYIFYFKSNDMSFYWNKPLTKGVSGISKVPAATLARVRDRRHDIAAEKGITLSEVEFK